MLKFFVSPGGREVHTSRKRFERMAFMPYGMWTCEDGREVLFNRFYEPIWQRAYGQVTAADPNEWVKWKTQSWFYEDALRWDGKASRAILIAWGISP